MALISTRANSAADGTAQIFLNGANGNRIDFSAVGSAPPATPTKSAGTKLVLFPGAAGLDYGLGIDASTLWASVPSTANFRWY